MNVNELIDYLLSDGYKEIKENVYKRDFVDGSIEVKKNENETFTIRNEQNGKVEYKVLDVKDAQNYLEHL